MSRLTRLRKGITVVRYFAFWGAVAIAIQIDGVLYHRMPKDAESNTTNK